MDSEEQGFEPKPEHEHVEPLFAALREAPGPQVEGSEGDAGWRMGMVVIALMAALGGIGGLAWVLWRWMV